MSCAVSSYQLSPLERAIQYHLHGEIQLAEAQYRECLAAQPNNPKASQFLGVLLFQNGNREEGLRLLEFGVKVAPYDSEAWSNLGNAYRVLGEGPKAIDALNKAIQLDVNNASAYCTLSACLRKETSLGESIEVARTATRLQPNLPQAHSNLGNSLLEAGETEAAIAAFNQALYLNPGFLEARQSLIFAMNYSDRCPASAISSEALKLNQLFTWNAVPVPSRSLKTVAFLSGDFRNHPVSYFLEPLLNSLGAHRYRVVLLDNSPTHDEKSAALSQLAHSAVDVTAMSPEDVLRVAEELQIDVLVDLAGHTASNRAEVVGQRMAPVQVSYLGFSGTTGLPNVDYVLADGVAVPTEHESQYSERVLRFASTLFCFDDSRVPREARELPALKRGHVTFGSFNNLSKLSPACLQAWADVLQAVPGSRLLIKSLHLGEPRCADRMLRQLLLRGVTPDRIDILGHVPDQDHFALIQSVDIILDSFPYTGATTTCEALACGIPVVTLVGDRYSARMSASILSAVGRKEWIAESIESYVATAQSLAGDLSALSHVRSTLRSELQDSRLCDQKTHADDFVALLEKAWAEATLRSQS